MAVPRWCRARVPAQGGRAATHAAELLSRERDGDREAGVDLGLQLGETLEVRAGVRGGRAQRQGSAEAVLGNRRELFPAALAHEVALALGDGAVLLATVGADDDAAHDAVPPAVSIESRRPRRRVTWIAAAAALVIGLVAVFWAAASFASK